MTDADIAAEVQRRQQARLARTAWPPLAPTHEAPTESKVSRWFHVPIASLFEQAGNRLYPRWGGLVECGHEPSHSSKSGRCVIINPTTGWWRCRSCNEHGDAATLVMVQVGCSYKEAARRLTKVFGPPAGSPAPRRRVWTVPL